MSVVHCEANCRPGHLYDFSKSSQTTSRFKIEQLAGRTTDVVVEGFCSSSHARQVAAVLPSVTRATKSKASSSSSWSSSDNAATSRAVRGWSACSLPRSISGCEAASFCRLEASGGGCSRHFARCELRGSRGSGRRPARPRGPTRVSRRPRGRRRTCPSLACSRAGVARGVWTVVALGLSRAGEALHETAAAAGGLKGSPYKSERNWSSPLRLSKSPSRFDTSCALLV